MPNPVVLALIASGVESAAFTALDFFTTSPTENLISQQQEINRQNKLRASGVFSDQDISGIMREYNDQVNQFAGGVAARGLGTSAIGAKQISQAQQAPFFQVQRQSAQAYQQGLSRLSQLIAQDREIKARQRESIGGLTQLGLQFATDKWGK